MTLDERISTLGFDPARPGPRIQRWKYDLLRRAILDAVPGGSTGVALDELSEAISVRISEHQLRRLGSLNWYLVTVKLDLEARGEIERIPDVHPQMLRRR